jgi:hypothetical protein
MKRHITLLGAAMLVASAAHAESATTTKATDLLAQAFADAKTVASLPADTKVDVLKRSGAWSEVKTSAGQTGWVRMMALKFGDGAGAKQDAGGNVLGALGGLASLGRTSNTATVTTGVKGLDKETLGNAQPNPEELKKLQKFMADKAAAQSFAQHSKLAANKVDYLPDPAPAKAGDKGNDKGSDKGNDQRSGG